MHSDELPPPFEEETVCAVAESHDVDPDRLETLVGDHQERVARLPGVANLVYEWRKQFDSVVLERTETWYVVAAPDRAWPEFVDDLGATDVEGDALAAVHARTARSVLDGDRSLAETTPIVLVRE